MSVSVANGDFPFAAATQSAAYTAVSFADFASRLAVTAAQATAQISILRYQKSQYDDIEERRVGYLDTASREFCECLNQLLPQIKAATDEIPKPAMYQAVSPFGEQWNTTKENIEMKPLTLAYAMMIGENHREADLARAVALNPRYYELNEITWTSIEELMRGELPIGLTVESLTRSASDSVANGRLGRAHGQFRRNIGIIDYRVQKEARAEQRAERQSQNQDVSPLSRQGDVRDMLVTPQQRISYGIQQAQFLQNSLQNAENACARKAPFLLQQLQVELQKCTQLLQLEAGKAGLVSGFVPNFAGIFERQINDIGESIGGLFGGNRRADNLDAFNNFGGFNTVNGTAGQAAGQRAGVAPQK